MHFKIHIDYYLIRTNEIKSDYVFANLKNNTSAHVRHTAEEFRVTTNVYLYIHIYVYMNLCASILFVLTQTLYTLSFSYSLASHISRISNV